MCTCVLTLVCLCVRDQPLVFCSTCPPCLLRLHLSVAWGTMVSLGWLVTEPKDFIFQVLGLQEWEPQQLGFFIWKMNLRLNACTASTLSGKPSPHSWLNFLIQNGVCRLKDSSLKLRNEQRKFYVYQYVIKHSSRWIYLDMLKLL